MGNVIVAWQNGLYILLLVEPVLAIQSARPSGNSFCIGTLSFTLTFSCVLQDWYQWPHLYSMTKIEYRCSCSGDLFLRWHCLILRPNSEKCHSHYLLSICRYCRSSIKALMASGYTLPLNNFVCVPVLVSASVCLACVSNRLYLPYVDLFSVHRLPVLLRSLTGRPVLLPWAG